MSLLFNVDYEQQLFSSSPVKLESNRVNQELEYFLFFLENEPVYSRRQYDLEYCHHLESMGFTVKTTDHKDNIHCWWGEYENLEQKRLLNSKLTSTRLAIENNLCHPATHIFDQQQELLPGLVYKDPTGVSGRGIYTKKDEQKVLGLLKKTPLICEPLLHRKQDISYLHLESEGLMYTNQVDDYFQYRGTTIAPLKLAENLQVNFEKAIQLVCKFMQEQGATGPWSLDGFTYEEDGKLKLYALSEINYRKTMGYVTYKLHQMWNEKGISQLHLIPTSKLMGQLPYLDDDGIRVLSPRGNRFASLFLQASDLMELQQKRDKLARDFGVPF